ncbi:MAG: BatA domain-containing protein [Candidatus Sumerlaeia bacterium]|nr:BatA domain-containing protein [Candidatus Sumerlaeia bacterium]
MAAAFLAPVFLAGLALLVAPWWIHQIRRPEREPVRFSSLMFIPQTRREVIERRRLQHILLMLLRMGLLALLALAFARPYLRKPAAAAVPAEGAAWHVILLDTSASMGRRFETARTRARAIADSLDAADRAGVIVFSRTPRMLAPLADAGNPEAGSAASARRAVAAAQLTEESTAYVPALQAALAMLQSAEGQSGAPAARQVIHLISDFQRAGLPEKTGGWKLPARVELRCVDVGGPEQAGCAIEDVSVRAGGADEVRVLGKVRNWSKSGEAVRNVKIVVGGREIARSSVTLAPGAARQVAFRVPVPPASSLEGWLEIEDEQPGAGKQRYFVWQAPSRQRVWLLSGAEGGPERTAVRFLRSALPTDGDLPWRLEVRSPEQAQAGLADSAVRPSILIVENFDKLSPEACTAVLGYIESGGRALLSVDASGSLDAANKVLLERLGVRAEGTFRSGKNESQFMLLGWIDFDHPVFHPLRSPEFNDFSAVRFYNAHRLALVNESAAPAEENGPRVLARFEPDSNGREWPAIIETYAGAGRAILWAFGLDLEWSNFPRSVKFIPVLYETLGLLAGGAGESRAWTVGERLEPPAETTAGQRPAAVVLPGETAAVALAENSEVRPARAGFVRWRSNVAAGGERVEAVNVAPSESNPERVSPEELQLKLCAPRVEPRETSPAEWEHRAVVGGYRIEREYWRWLLGALMMLLIWESLNAAAVWVRRGENSRPATGEER